MIAAHVARGSTPRAALALGLGVLSHVILDALPHGDYGELGMAAMVPVVMLEFIVAIIVLTRILRDRVMTGWPVAIAAGVVGACIPDFKFLARLLLPPDVAVEVAEYGNQLHRPFHADPTSLGVGTTIEVGATLLLLALLTRFPRRHRA